jgi:hypothetical protein
MSPILSKKMPKPGMVSEVPMDVKGGMNGVRME